jgi:hypothetical protein
MKVTDVRAVIAIGLRFPSPVRLSFLLSPEFVGELMRVLPL